MGPDEVRELVAGLQLVSCSPTAFPGEPFVAVPDPPHVRAVEGPL